MADHSPNADAYFVPTQSKWPFVGSIAMFVMMIGVASWLNDADQALYEAKANGRNQLRRARPERTAA